MTMSTAVRSMGRFPWWSRLVLGVACVVLGAVITFRPYTSLTALIVLAAIGLVVTGIGRVSLARSQRGSWLAWIAGLTWIVAGVVAVAWPDLTVFGLAVVVGVAMITGGVVDVLTGFGGSADERVASVLWGLASVVFGVLALSWPDVTLLVVAVFFGASVVVFGVRLVFDSLRRRNGAAEPAAAPARAGWFRRTLHVVVALGALVLALALAGVSASINEGEPVVDAFYDPPDDLPADPGVLIRAEPFDRAIPDGATAWRLLYTTTRDEGQPALASAIVVVPDDAGGTPPPVIAWAHGTTGVDETCAPSVLDDPWSAGAFFLLDDVVEQGWALVATDYVGLGTAGPHPYLVGQAEGRSVLDAVRAARQLDDAELGAQTVVWGHSQGGHAALWTGLLAPTYAPDVPLDGVAALAPASDLLGLVSNLGNVPGGSLFATYVMEGYSQTYPDVRLEDYVRAAARATFAETAKRCLAEPAALVSVVESVTGDMSIFERDLTTGPVVARFEENTPNGRIQAPLLLGQGADDQLVLADVQAAFVDQWCAAGQPIDFRTYPGRDHVPLVEADSPLVPELLAWTVDRFAGEEPTPTCG